MWYRVNPSLVLRSRWHPYQGRPGERVLVLKTASAFPPSHPTTRLCLDLLREALSGSLPASLLDVGCGTGVLLLAAAALGVPFGLGVDVSAAAARLSRENALMNGLTQTAVVRGSTDCLRGRFGMILANLPIAAHLFKAADLSRLAAPGALLIASGFKDTQEEEVWGRYRQAGWELLSRRTREDWLAPCPPEPSSTWVAGCLKLALPR